MRRLGRESKVDLGGELGWRDPEGHQEQEAHSREEERKAAQEPWATEAG